VSIVLCTEKGMNMKKTYDETIMRMCREIGTVICSQKIIDRYMDEGYREYPTKLGIGRTLSNFEKRGWLINKRVQRVKVSYKMGSTIFLYDVKP
jgi:hypothetical protein